MTPEERQLLTVLFDRVRSASGNTRDPDAEAFIADQVRAQPYAPYLMAQAVIVQEEGLKKAAARIEELEHALAQQQQSAAPQSGGFLGSVFGGGARGSVPSTAMARAPANAPRPTGPWAQAQFPLCRSPLMRKPNRARRKAGRFCAMRLAWLRVSRAASCSPILCRRSSRATTIRMA